MEDCAWENWDKLTRRRHPNCTCGARRTRHQFAINALNTKHEATNNYVLISSQGQEYKQGQLMSQKINMGLSFSLMTIKASVTHLLCALMMKRNRQSNGSKWAVHFRAPIDNVLAVEHKYRHSLFIKVRNNYKRKEKQNSKVYTNTHPKNHSKSISL